VVEDSPTQAQSLKYMLEAQGYGVALASNGRQALAYVSGFKPALVISDIHMPELNGYKLCEHLKADEATRLIPVILLTSLSDVEDVLEALVCGADSFISKPYSKDYLLSHIKQTLAVKLLRPDSLARIEVNINLAGRERVITADWKQILSLLLSTYHAAAHRNSELREMQEELSLLNEHLEGLVEERTAALSSEILERERLQVELQAQSICDELTGLNNRRGFMTLAEQHWRLALRARQDFALLYVDLNDFKKINDTLGHAQGDQALRDVARVLEQTFRDSDILARFGGDEFTVLFTDCDLPSARQATGRLKENLTLATVNGATRYSLSSSVGLAHFNPDNQATISDLLAQADADMYTHKPQSPERGGR